MNIIPMLPGGLGLILFLVIFCLTALVHICFAFAVFVDAGLMEQRERRSTFLVGGGLWALATLLGGLVVVSLYWLIHHSTLRPQ